MKQLPHTQTYRIEQIAAQELTLKKQAIIEHYLSDRQPDLLLLDYSNAIESILGMLWQELLFDNQLCLVAIGGLGRQEVYPFSDLDLAIVSRQSLSEKQQEKIAQFIRVLWDINLKPAVKSGSIDELCIDAADDLTSDTAFLEARFLFGNHTIAEQWMTRLNLQRDITTFIEGKLLEQQQRHAKSQGAGAILEANVKTAPGGLRDIHTLLWLAKAQGLPADFAQLATQRILTQTEASLLIRSHRQLAQIRIELHLSAQRSEERLLFDFQGQIAKNMGLVDDEHALGNEKLMHRFYRATKSVKQLSEILTPMLCRRIYSPLPRVIVEIDQDYYQVGNLLAIRNKQLFFEQPEHIFKALSIIQQRKDIKGLAPKTLRQWWEASQHIDEDFQNNPINQQTFLHFFQYGDGLTHTLRYLNLYGVLGRYLPSWGKIVGLLQHDLFHIYPVDDHILMVVRNVRRLAMEKHSHELPFASSLMHSFSKPYMVYLAAFFHDIAKGRGGDHAKQGIIDAQKFSQTHGLSEEDGQLLSWLVEHHLLMSSTAQKEDIQDPSVIDAFCQKVQTQERLTALYLLTVADIRGTNPKIWNSWKAGLLQNLFQAASQNLSGIANSPSRILSQRQLSAIEILNQQQVSEKAQNRLWKLLGNLYFLRHEIEEITWHIPFLIHREEQAQNQIQILPNEHIARVMVYMPNRAFIFADLCRIFSDCGLNILTARAYSTEHQYILDTFIIELPHHHIDDKKEVIQQLETALSTFISGQYQHSSTSRQTLFSRRTKHLPIAPIINIISEDKLDWYTLEIITANRRYLLADIAQVLAENHVSIHYAKITTLDERVEDSFYIYSPDLVQTKQQLMLKKDLLAKIS